MKKAHRGETSYELMMAVFSQRSSRDGDETAKRLSKETKPIEGPQPVGEKTMHKAAQHLKKKSTTIPLSTTRESKLQKAGKGVRERFLCANRL